MQARDEERISYAVKNAAADPGIVDGVFPDPPLMKGVSLSPMQELLRKSALRDLQNSVAKAFRRLVLSFFFAYDKRLAYNSVFAERLGDDFLSVLEYLLEIG